ncbi:predicted protein [Naegleria gruberi]|uniref:Predicted protein n=1 Tax=Naegleria gruberi TaxID=5762 RepID=D2VBC3_NAEGR|nr:uncharacterized protein NAEGRDRAFT_48158 [Naegleria gruberi]EFC45772.1 predicted protein [Naegleria gruberi]|eukprot:XP_002678516.1 predicted protein [Naegleria gruberi strain NEG-M]
MFSSFGNSGEGISFDDFFGFSEDTSSTAATSSTLNVVVQQQSVAASIVNTNEKKQAQPLLPKNKTLTHQQQQQPSVATMPKKPAKEVIGSSEEESSSDDDEEMKDKVQPGDDSDEDEEMKEKEYSSSSSSSESSQDEIEDISIRKSTNIGKQIVNGNKENHKQSVNTVKKAPPKQSNIQHILNKVPSSSSSVPQIGTKKKLSPLKEKRNIKEKTDNSKRKFIQTKLDKSMFERRVEQTPMDSSLFCMCCNTFVALTGASSQNSAKRVKKGSSKYEEWDKHIESEDHLLRKERLQRLNVLCFMNSPTNKRFHHFVNSFCLMFFHRIETLAIEFAKKNRKRKFEIYEEHEDYILLDYVINFIYARVANLQYATDFEKILKQFLNNMRQGSLKIATTIWEQYKEFYSKMNDDEFGYLLSDIVHRAWDCMRHLAYFGKIQDPTQLFIDEPLEFKDFKSEKKESRDESDSSSDDEDYEEPEYDEDEEEEEDIFNGQHPYFEMFMKMYIQHFLFLKPIEKIISEALEQYKSILEKETFFNEWEEEIVKRKKLLISQQQMSSNGGSAVDDESSDESPTIPPPKPQAPKQKSIEDLLFGSAANNTFESFFSVNTTPQKVTTTIQTQSKKKAGISTHENETMEEDEMWNLLRRDNI